MIGVVGIVCVGDIGVFVGIEIGPSVGVGVNSICVGA